MLNIIEVMRLPIGTKLKIDIYEDIVLEIIEKEDGRKYLTLEDDFRRFFVDSVLTECKFSVIKRP